MDVKDLKRLLESVKESGISELVLETGDYKLSVKRGTKAALDVANAPQAALERLTAAPEPAPSAPTHAPTEAAPVQAPTPAPTAPPAADSTLSEITAPIVGTFYAAPGPDAPDFVKVGDRVEAGTVLCIIEAMKLMNEIETEVTGTVREILVRNEEPVEYGQPLFRLEPV